MFFSVYVKLFFELNLIECILATITLTTFKKFDNKLKSAGVLPEHTEALADIF